MKQRGCDGRLWAGLLTSAAVSPLDGADCCLVGRLAGRGANRIRVPPTCNRQTEC